MINGVNAYFPPTINAGPITDQELNAWQGYSDDSQTEQTELSVGAKNLTLFCEKSGAHVVSQPVPPANDHQAQYAETSADQPLLPVENRWGTAINMLMSCTLMSCTLAGRTLLFSTIEAGRYVAYNNAGPLVEQIGGTILNTTTEYISNKLREYV
ncbi:hypothetical protein [Yersinia aleksiciae]|uniref:Uncharacterized protein n=1 Tax=Yersinia aleksiciae TaxID=263819 RepID=A0ABM5UA27_YERAE|nr:hypothetical protein [Yersinia aleksiciae]AKP32688.1 hypothetical protein ACZ76_03565 [Yersinia aleksiciae]CFQ36769.1 Uncharacterised protein [Yersinia aleksiciae]